MTEVETTLLVVKLIAAHTKVKKSDVEEWLASDFSIESLFKIDSRDVNEIAVHKCETFWFDQVSVLKPALLHDSLVKVCTQHSKPTVFVKKWHTVVATTKGPIKHLQTLFSVFDLNSEFTDELRNFSVHDGVVRHSFDL